MEQTKRVPYGLDRMLILYEHLQRKKPSKDQRDLLRVWLRNVEWPAAQRRPIGLSLLMLLLANNGDALDFDPGIES